RLRQRHFGGIQVATRKSSLVEEVFARFVYLLLRLECRFGGGRIEFRFLDLLRKTGARCGCITRFRLLKFAFALFRGAAKIGVFENRQDLTLLHMAAALYIKLAD